MILGYMADLAGVDISDVATEGRADNKGLFSVLYCSQTIYINEVI